jgi:hypothetical protein
MTQMGWWSSINWAASRVARSKSSLLSPANNGSVVTLAGAFRNDAELTSKLTMGRIALLDNGLG